MGKATIITDKNFDSEVVKFQGLGVVDFGATWCGPCQALAPTIEELAGEYSGSNVKICKCDVDEASDLAAQWGIMSVPTIIFFKNGKQVDSVMGNQKKQVLKDKIEKHRA